MAIYYPFRRLQNLKYAMFSIAIAEAIAKNDCVWQIYFLAMALLDIIRVTAILGASMVENS